LCLFRFVSWNQKEKFGFFRCFEPTVYWNNRNKRICFVTNRNNPKFVSQINSLLNCLGWVFCLFWFNRNIENLFRCRSETTETNVVL
jgi:hypothetical protein